jgi:Protein-disulfide isomerase
VVDTSAILAATAAIAYWFKGDEGHDGALSQGGWGALGAVAVIAPLLFGKMQPDPEVKASVSRYWVPGKVNIVELSDFECPFCRIQHASLKTAMEPFGDKINFVRVTVPLGSHANARPASKAYVCARDLGKGEIMAHALFTTELSKESIDKMVADFASQQGVDLEKFKACISDPKTDACVSEEFSRARDQIGFKGLPTTWVGKKLFEGAAGPDSLKKAIESEIDGKGSLRPQASPVWLWSGLVGLFVAFGAWALRRTRN